MGHWAWGIGNWSLGIWNQHSTDNTQQTTLNRKQSTVNSQQTTLNSQQSTANSQQSTENSQQKTVNSQQSTVNRQHMTEVTAISAQAAALLVHYGFDLGGKKAEKLAGEWLTKYPGYWLRLAVVEALYQGRYKAVSVGQLLSMWHRIGEPLYHFNREFERLVCNNFPQNLTGEIGDQMSQEDILFSNPESQVGVAELDLRLPSEAQLDVALHAEVPNTEAQETGKLPAADDRTKENTEFVVYEDVAITALADRAEAEHKLADKPVAKSFPVVKHTDFHTKLKAIAREGRRKKGESRKRV
ncbi:hypothetical protein [Microcoleus sp. D2_18a_B4]|uniref:hypothetical protein n=1 Tax=Microcoleus sp. D2_18a_B4 TaxID=3055329 RepID=UPI002FD0E2CF